MNKITHRFDGDHCGVRPALGGFTKAQATSDQPAVSSKPVYAYYYLWWSSNHWRNKLGPNYPYRHHSTAYLPGRCQWLQRRYATMQAISCWMSEQNYLVRMIPGIIQYDIQVAKNAGITGFWLNWSGAGTTTQTRTECTVYAQAGRSICCLRSCGRL